MLADGSCQLLVDVVGAVEWQVVVWMLVFLWVWLNKVCNMGVAVEENGLVLQQHSYQNVNLTHSKYVYLICVLFTCTSIPNNTMLLIYGF